MIVSPIILALLWSRCSEKVRLDANRLLGGLYGPGAGWFPDAALCGTTLAVDIVRLSIPLLAIPPAPYGVGAFQNETVASIAEANRRWLAIPKGRRPRHPLEPLVDAWQDRSRPLNETRLIVTQERRPPPKQEPLLLVRTPGILSLLSNTTLEAVEVDGRAIATFEPDGERRRIYRIQHPQQGELFAGPRTLDGRATGGILVDAVARLPLTGDERTPLRFHLLRLGAFAYALTSAATLTTAEGALLLTGRDTPESRASFLDVMSLLRSLVVEGRPGERWAVAEAEPGDPHRIGPPGWWLAKRGLLAYRLTGILCRRIKGDRRSASRWGSLERTIAGIECALLWGRTSGRGRGGGLADTVRAVRKGGPGPIVFIPWWQFLRLAGDYVPADAARQSRNALTQRYKRRVDSLETRDYFTDQSGVASAHDTVEILGRVRPARSREAGILVRATARFCAAYAGAGERVRLPASQLIDVA